MATSNSNLPFNARQKFFSVIAAATSGAIAGIVLWIIVVSLRMTTRNLVPNVQRILHQLPSTVSFGLKLIGFIAAFNVVAQVSARSGQRLRTVVLMSVAVQVTFVFLTALMLDYGVMSLGAINATICHWLIVGIILYERRTRLSQADALFIEFGPVIMVIIARILVQWIRDTR